jgi:PAS domain S-box-containing protein
MQQVEHLVDVGPSLEGVVHAMEKELEERVLFEAFLANLSVRFINLAATEVDSAIEGAQRFICEALGLDRSALYQFFDAEPDSLLLTHVYERGENPLPRRAVEKRVDPKLHCSTYWAQTDPQQPGAYSRIEAKAFFPWTYQQLRRGDPVIISNPEDLPAEAAQDQEMLRRFATQSTVVIPMTGGKTSLGCITFATVRARRQWSDLEVRRFRFVADLFTNALVRTRDVEDLRRSEKKFRKLHESMRDAFVSRDLSGRILEFNSAYEQMLGYSGAELRELNYLELTPEKWHAAEEAIIRDQVLGRGYSDVYEKESRKKDGTVFPVELRVFLLRDDADQPIGMWAIVRDITERKLAEEALKKSYAEIKELKDRLQAESDYLRTEMKTSQAHGQIIGRSEALKRVLHQTEQVAQADCAVLISGETGTGKELIAQEIHRLSARKDHLMVLVNCAALPSALVESELFGRERGAYTGALTSQVGRFEMANHSTIFLDEVGELSMEVQGKLLRVLQDGEFQRLGSPKTHKVDVRVIAATNRDLAEEAREGRFREDLFYRLRVFPIEIPSLRERLEDLPLLVSAFMEEFSTRMGKRITRIPRKAMELLQAHPWPGNIRELRNVIEHSVILTPGDTLKLTLLAEAPTRESPPVTLAEAERQHILKTLESTGWRIKGPHGAARRLDLQPSTLYSRMQKLGIPHRRQKDEMSAQG